MCLVASPFNPINNRIEFRLDRISGANKRSICLGVCLLDVVKNNGFANCNGSGKGVYAIDQNYPYNNTDTILASWNHHDNTYNQTNVGNNDIIVRGL